MMKLNKKNVIFFSVLFFLCFIAIMFLFHVSQGTKANIYVDGRLYQTIILTDYEVDTEILIETQYGYNKLLIQNEKIRVLEADCPDKTCVKTGFTNSSSKPVICIPHRLEIVISDSSELDGVSG